MVKAIELEQNEHRTIFTCITTEVFSIYAFQEFAMVGTIELETHCVTVQHFTVTALRHLENGLHLLFARLLWFHHFV